METYVLDTWYPLTWSRNVGRQLSAHRIVERDVVLYRTEAGAVVAMEDACPHACCRCPWASSRAMPSNAATTA